LDIQRKIKSLESLAKEKYFFEKGKLKHLLKSRLREDVVSEVDKLAQEIYKYEVISFDVFDTCIFGTIDTFRDARKVKAVEYGKMFGKNPSVFLEHWNNAYKKCMKNLTPENEEITVFELYQEFAKMAGHPIEDVPKLVDIEKEVELKLCFQNPLIHRIYRTAKEQGKKVIFISDMYLSKEIIGAMLSKSGYDSQNLYVGSEYRKTKYKGSLFDLVLEKEEIDPKKMLHIGDNPHSDINQAKSRGINAFYFRKNDLEITKYDFERNFFKEEPLSLNESLTIGLVRKNSYLSESGLQGDERTLYDIGYEVVGPTQLSFLLWIVKRAKQNNLKKLFFLSRDGYYLEKSFQKLKDKFNLEMEGEYLFSSRKLYFLPRYTELNDESLEFFATAHQKLKARDFLIRLGIDPEMHQNVFQATGFNSFEETVTDDVGNFLNDEYRKKNQAAFDRVER
jgi:predicted HAD superfamily hydrolase